MPRGSAWISAQADVLDRYQRWRRFDTMAMGLATNSLNFLFSNQSTLLRTVRDIGLGLVDRAPPLKNLFIRQAAGLSGEVPRLLKGEALVGANGVDSRLASWHSHRSQSILRASSGSMIGMPSRIG